MMNTLYIVIRSERVDSVTSTIMQCNAILHKVSKYMVLK